MGGCMWIICKYHAFYIRDLYKVHWGYRGMTYHCVYFSIIYKNQICKQPHYPLMEYHSAIKKNGMLPFVTIWTLCYMNLSQIKTNTIWSQLHVEPKKQTNKKNPTQSWLTPLWALKSMISHSDVTQLGSYKSGPLRKLPEGAGKPAFRGLSISYGFCITLHELLSLLCGSVFPSVIWNNTRIARLFGGLKELKMQWVPIGLCKLTRS